jgi:hypothetical protein
VQQYEANARAERYLRERSPGAKEAIDGTIVGQTQAAGALATSASAVVPIVRQAAGQFHLLNRALAAADRTGGSMSGSSQLDDPIARIDAGTYQPDAASRLGAYAATSGYPPGTVGEAVHNAIGTIYATLGTAGQEQIGKVFNSPEARALLAKPLTPETSTQIARLEHDYWTQTRRDNPLSLGGNLGSAAWVGLRDLLQRHIFSTTPRPVIVAPPRTK